MIIIYIETLLKENKLLTFISFVVLIFPVSLTSKLFFIWALVNCYYFAKKYNNIANPASVFLTIFLLIIGFSQMKLTPLEKYDFTLKTWIALYAVIFGFYLSIFVASKTTRHIENVKSEVKNNIVSKRLLYLNCIILAVELVLYAYIYIKVGGIPLQSDNIRANIMPKVISGYIMTLAIYPSYLIIINSFFFIISKDFKYMLFNFIFMLLILTLGGRINILLPLGTSIILIYLVKYAMQGKGLKLSKSIIIVLIVIVGLLAAIPALRTKEYSNNYYKHIYEYKDEERAPEAILPVWLNLSTNLHAFDKLVIYLDKTKDYQYGKMGLLRPVHFITKYFYTDKIVNFEEIWRGWLNSPTFLFYPYYDLGVFGVFLFTFVIGYVGSKLFTLAMNRGTILYLSIYSYFCTSLVLLIFVNHFLRSAFYVDTVNLTLLYLLMTYKSKHLRV